MEVRITINCDNAGFRDARYGILPEVGRILADLATRLKCMGWAEGESIGSIPIMDVNGNMVGQCKFTDDSDLSPTKEHRS